MHIANRPPTRLRNNSATTLPTIKHACKYTVPAHPTSDRFASRTAPPMACPPRHKAALQDCQGCRTAKRGGGRGVGPNVITVFCCRNAGHHIRLCSVTSVPQCSMQGMVCGKDRDNNSQTVQKNIIGQLLQWLLACCRCSSEPVLIRDKETEAR